MVVACGVGGNDSREVLVGRGGRGDYGYWGGAVPPDPPALPAGPE